MRILAYGNCDIAIVHSAADALLGAALLCVGKAIDVDMKPFLNAYNNVPKWYA